MCRIKLLRFMMILLPLIVFATAATGASQTEQRADLIIVDGDNNETTKAELDSLNQAAKGKLIILISRLGAREISNALARRRLQTIVDYLKNTRAVPSERLVTGVGQRVRGLGSVEVYLDGKLFMVFKLSRNKDFAPEP